MATSSNTSESTQQVLFGMIMDINGVEVKIAANPAEVAEKGLQFKLEVEDKDLGTIEDLITWFNDNFGTSIPDASELPQPWSDVLTKLEQLNFTINKLDLDLPTKGDKSYDFKFSASFDSNNEPTIIDKLKLKGGSFAATNVNEDGSSSGE